MSTEKAPSFRSYESTSEQASRAMAGNTKKWTRCERVLHQALRELSRDPETHRRDLPGRPDFVFPKEEVVVFVDGDFWHGRNWRQRKKKLKEGSNAGYWVAKIQANIDRDRRQGEELSEAGWTVVRLWETDILDDPAAAAEQIGQTLEKAAG